MNIKLIGICKTLYHRLQHPRLEIVLMAIGLQGESTAIESIEQ